jgi:membrane protease YdiL (CAAX protease family)
MSVPPVDGLTAVLPLPSELVWATWLVSLAPGAVSFAVSRPFGGFSGRTRRRIHLIALAGVSVVVMAVCGLPKSATPSAGWLAVACLSGIAYYLAERGRLTITHRGALRASRRSAWSTGGRWLVVDGGALACAGALEELLFRWYGLWLPVWFGLVPVTVAIVVSALMYGALHHEEGIGVMASRTVLGAALGTVVATTGQLWVAVAVHVIYNIAVQVAPVQYLRPTRREFAR